MIEVEHVTLYIFNSLDGVSVIVKSKCFLSVTPPGARPPARLKKRKISLKPLFSWPTVEYPKCLGFQAWLFLQGAQYLDGFKAG